MTDTSGRTTTTVFIRNVPVQTYRAIKADAAAHRLNPQGVAGRRAQGKEGAGEVTKTEARKAWRYLSRTGWRDGEIIRYERSWRLYATDPGTGYRKHWDNMTVVQEQISADSL